MSPDDRIAQMTRFYEALNQFDLETLTRMVSPDYIEHFPALAVGREAFRLARQRTRQALSAVRVEVLRLQPIEELSLLASVLIHGIHTGPAPYMGQEPGGKRIVIFASSLIRFNENGLLTEHWENQVSGTTIMDTLLSIRS
jgi:predicted SnoaL-like aldol condensation-catalyzing enzyme